MIKTKKHRPTLGFLLCWLTNINWSSRSLLNCSPGWPNKSQLHIVTSTSVILLGFCSRLTDHGISAQQKALTLADIDFGELHYWFDAKNNLSNALIEHQCITWSTVILIIKRFRRFLKLYRRAVFLKPKYPTNSITRMNGQFPSHQPTSGLLLWGLTEKNPGIGSLFSFDYELTAFITSFLS